LTDSDSRFLADKGTGDRGGDRVRDRRLIGLGLALITAFMWATIPIMLKVLVTALDPVTLTCVRFLTAGLLILPIVVFNGSHRPLWRLRGAVLATLLFGALALAGNYVTFMAGIRFISPGTAQVIMQATPMFVLLASLLIFKEHLGRQQWLGFAILVGGQILFFFPRYRELLTLSGSYSRGVLLVLISAISWTGYMICQKRMGGHLSPAAGLCFIYLFGGLLFLPFTKPAMVLNLEVPLLVVLFASGAATLISYFLFAISLQYAESSRIGVVIALMPIFTVIVMEIFTATYPGILDPERLETSTIAGALLVVAGVMLGALGSRSKADAS
jgi:drug/metabolite transporter (DMT)-like permease